MLFATTRPRLLAATLLTSLLSHALGVALAVNGETQHPRSLRAFYFGNSYLENSVPWFHPTLAHSAQRELILRTSLGPGWQLWMHVDAFLKPGNSGFKPFDEGDWNAVVLHIFGAHPMLKDNVRESVFTGQAKFPEPRDISDSASAAFLIEKLLAKAPDTGRAFIYTSWPGIDGAAEFRKRVAEEAEKSYAEQGLPREEVLRKIKERKPTAEEMRELVATFNYEASWLGDYVENREVPHQSKRFHSRSYTWGLMDLLKSRYPQLWQQRRLALIPNGDVFLALDQKMRSGAVPGLDNVGLFSRDGGHIRAGLPRYTLAATCFAVMFGAHPKALDYTIYNDLANYELEALRGLPGVIGSAYIHQPDLGELLPITSDLAAIVNETVWEVVTQHPYTQLSQ